MTTGKIVEIKDNHFVLAEAASQLFANTEEASNIAYLSQYVGMLGEVENPRRRVLLQGRRSALQRLFPFSPRDGRGQRAKHCRRSSRSHPSSRSRSHPRSAKRHQRPRHRLRTRTRAAASGASQWKFVRSRTSKCRHSFTRSRASTA